MAPCGKKPNKPSHDDHDVKTKKQSFFKQRFPGFKKKATELSVLCGNSVGFICYGPDNDLHVWPEPQDNPQALRQIVGKFNALSDHKRKNHACDLYDFPGLKGLSGEDMRNHLDKLNSQLVGIKQHKVSVIRRNSKKPKPKETEEDDYLRVSDNATISNSNVVSSEDQNGNQVGFGGVFDELGYVFRGSHETLPYIGSRDVGVSDGNDGAWDLSWMDLEFPSTLFTGSDPLLGASDSFTASTYQTSVTDNLGSVF